MYRMPEWTHMCAHRSRTPIILYVCGLRIANGSMFVFLLSIRLSCKNRNHKGINGQGVHAIGPQFNLILYFCSAKKKKQFSSFVHFGR